MNLVLLFLRRPRVEVGRFYCKDGIGTQGTSLVPTSPRLWKKELSSELSMESSVDFLLH